MKLCCHKFGGPCTVIALMTTSIALVTRVMTTVIALMTMVMTTVIAFMTTVIALIVTDERRVVCQIDIGLLRGLCKTRCREPTCVSDF